jgi:hypothetical protein
MCRVFAVTAPAAVSRSRAQKRRSAAPAYSRASGGSAAGAGACQRIAGQRASERASSGALFPPTVRLRSSALMSKFIVFTAVLPFDCNGSHVCETERAPPQRAGARQPNKHAPARRAPPLCTGVIRGQGHVPRRWRPWRCERFPVAACPTVRGQRAPVMRTHVHHQVPQTPSTHRVPASPPLLPGEGALLPPLPPLSPGGGANPSFSLAEIVTVQTHVVREKAQLLASQKIAWCAARRGAACAPCSAGGSSPGGADAAISGCAGLRVVRASCSYRCSWPCSCCSCASDG